MADILTTDEERVDAPQMGGGGSPSALAAMATKARRVSRYEELFTGTAKNLVKGAGHVVNNGVPLSEATHGTEIAARSRDTIIKSRAAALSGAWDTDDVLAGISPEFWNHPKNPHPAMYFQALESAATRKNFAANIGKNFTAGNLAQSGTPYGLVPFDLLAPSRLVYPIYTLLRNKIARPAGQGASRQVRGILGVSGSQTGGQGIIDISIPELVESGGTLANTSWPLNIPKSGSQTQYALNVPCMN